MGTEPVSLPTVEVRTAAPQVLRGFQNTHAGAQDLHRIAPNPTAQEVAALSPDPTQESQPPPRASLPLVVAAVGEGWVQAPGLPGLRVHVALQALCGADLVFRSR